MLARVTMTFRGLPRVLRGRQLKSIRVEVLMTAKDINERVH